MTFFLGFSPPETTREGGGRRGTLAVTHSLNFYQDELDPAKHTKERWWKGKKSWTSKNCRRQQFIIKVSSWRFYNRQEEVLDQKSPKVIDRFVFNYLAVDNAGQTADNKHTGSMIFPFFLLASKTDKPLGDDTFQNQSVKLICWQAFSFIRFFNCFFLFSF